jgi:hypothetical protein
MSLDIGFASLPLLVDFGLSSLHVLKSGGKLYRRDYGKSIYILLRNGDLSLIVFLSFCIPRQTDPSRRRPRLSLHCIELKRQLMSQGLGCRFSVICLRQCCTRV